jgi:hypothetical protein
MSKEEKFNEMWLGLIIKLDFNVAPNKVFFFKKNKYYFGLNLKSRYLSYSDDNVSKIFNMEDLKFKYFIKDQVQQRLGIKNIKPYPCGKDSILHAEKYFNDETRTI